MARTFQVTIDCADPSGLADFWAAALGYVPADPPEGFATWESWLRAMEVPEEDWDPGPRPYNALVDPGRGGPRMWFQRVPEPKPGKNRVHLDLNVSPDPRAPLQERKGQVGAEVERLARLGGRRLATYEEGDHYHVVMQDPEGNEFCVE
jgi:Glyoxalase-like domain